MFEFIIDFYLRILCHIFNFIAYIIGNIFYPSKVGYLPPIKNSLLLEPASKLAEKIKAGKVKSEDVVKAYIERIKEVNGEINALVQDNFDDALKKAREADELVQKELNGDIDSTKKSIKDLPFFGVPFTVKNSIPIKGFTYTAGCVFRKNVISDCDCDVTRRMKENSGAIFIGITNVPELVYWYDSFNRVHGQCNNPYDKSRIPGGSTGGEGSLISACGSVIGCGSDIGGSIRLPAHFNGIFGHYTTPKAVLIDEIFPKTTSKRLEILSMGPMCRYASDLRPMLKIFVGDKLELPEKPLNYNNLNVYYVRQIPDPLATQVDVEILQGLDKCVKFFIEKGCKTLELNMDKNDPKSFYDFRHTLALWSSAMYEPDGKSVAETMTGGLEKINPFWEAIKCAFGCNEKYTLGVLFFSLMDSTVLKWLGSNKDYEIMLERLRKNLYELLGDNSIIICPPFPEIAPKHNQTILKTGSVVYTSVWNTMKTPITVVPMGLDRHGLPYGLQIITSPFNDNLTIQVAEELEKKFGGWVPPSQIQVNN